MSTANDRAHEKLLRLREECRAASHAIHDALNGLTDEAERLHKAARAIHLKLAETEKLLGVYEDGGDIIAAKLSMDDPADEETIGSMRVRTITAAMFAASLLPWTSV